MSDADLATAIAADPTNLSSMTLEQCQTGWNNRAAIVAGKAGR